MLLPLTTDRPLRRPTLVNHLIIGVCLAVYVGEVLLSRADPEAFQRLMDAVALAPGRSGPWTYLTYAFLHDHTGVLHILGNLLILWVFGPNVEDRFGRIGYLAFYLCASAASGGAHALLDGHPVVGASGAISAVTGAFLILFPRTQVRLLLFFIVIGVFEIPAWVFILIAILRDFTPWAGGVQDGVAYQAHIGGYVFGISVSLFLLATRLLAREPYDLFTMGRQAARRRQLRELKFQQERALRSSGGSKARPGQDDDVARARAEVSHCMNDADMPGAAGAYRKLLEVHGRAPALLHRRAQYELANYLYQSGDHITASTAYEIFLVGYPTDPETPVVRVMLGLISANHLNDPVRAKQELTEALKHLPPGEHRHLAEQLLSDLG